MQLMIFLILFFVWQFIQNKLKSKSKLAIVNENLDKDVLIKTDEKEKTINSNSFV